MPIVLDDSAWPILRSSVHPATIEAFDAFAVWYTAAMLRAQREGVFLYMLSDARGEPPPNAVVRHIAAWQATLSTGQLERCALNVVVIDNVLVRRVLTAINWFKPPPTPQIVVANHRQGFQAMVEDIGRRGLPPPPRPAWVDLD